MVVVTNGSDRPIREVACKIEVIEVDENIRRQKPADVYGEIATIALGPGATAAETFVPQARASTVPALRAGHKAGFVWDFTVAQYTRFLVWVRFTDDAGLHWEVTTDRKLSFPAGTLKIESTWGVCDN
jgi:hypothetical protein